MKKKQCPDDMKAGDELDKLVALNVYKGRNASWFIKDKKNVIYVGPKFSTDIADSMAALKTYCTFNSVRFYNLNEQSEEGPYSCTAEIGVTPEPMRYSRSWGPTLPLAIARVLAKAPRA